MDTSDQLLADRMHRAGGTIPLPPADPADDVRRGRARLRRRRVMTAVGTAAGIAAVVVGVAVLAPGETIAGDPAPAVATQPGASESPTPGIVEGVGPEPTISIPPGVQEAIEGYETAMVEHLGELRFPEMGGDHFFEDDTTRGKIGEMAVDSDPSSIFLEAKADGALIMLTLDREHTEETAVIEPADPAEWDRNWDECMVYGKSRADNHPATCEVYDVAGAVRAGTLTDGDTFLASVINPHQELVTIQVDVRDGGVTPYPAEDLFELALDPAMRLP